MALFSRIVRSRARRPYLPGLAATTLRSSGSSGGGTRRPSGQEPGKILHERGLVNSPRVEDPIHLFRQMPTRRRYSILLDEYHPVRDTCWHGVEPNARAHLAWDRQGDFVTVMDICRSTSAATYHGLLNRSAGRTVELNPIRRYWLARGTDHDLRDPGHAHDAHKISGWLQRPGARRRCAAALLQRAATSATASGADFVGERGCYKVFLARRQQTAVAGQPDL